MKKVTKKLVKEIKYFCDICGDEHTDDWGNLRKCCLCNKYYCHKCKKGLEVILNIVGLSYSTVCFDLCKICGKPYQMVEMTSPRKKFM